MSWASELPVELLCRPMGLVVLTGLDTTFNALHKAVWDSFCNNRRPDRVPLQFSVLGVDHEYPKCRSKRTSYEWYIPKGILRRGWMKKHVELIPSVVVVFFDLDWDEQMWKEKQMECSTKIQIVRDSLKGRSTRVAVVLIQKNTPLPPGEDVIAAERAASLCSACDLSAKSLFVLPLTDHLLGYTIRLENAFYELAQSYYHTEARRVKAHKEFLNKTTHQLLFVRHQFKIAFYNELKQDTHTALKHYKAAYSHIVELKMHPTNLLEIKTLAGFINYKICRLSFQHNAPLDSIGQFRKHIDFFKAKVGIPELAFEHSAWMSKQFQVFGDLFDEAIKLGLTAIQTQHPGFYYQQAANHAVARKQLCRGLCHPGTTAPSPDPLEGLSSLDYYGQRPWRQGHQSIDPPDALKEKDGVQALQAMELHVDHSWSIIPLLSSAVAQFKKYKSPRMKRFLMVQMGEEYYHAQDYIKALSLLTRVTWDYRQEQWWPLLTSILATALRCAYLVANIQEYVTIGLEMIGKVTQCPSEEKTRIQMNLIRVMNNESPEAEPGCNAACVEKAKSLWQSNTAATEPCIFTVEMHNIVAFVECKATFVQPTFKADSRVQLSVYLRTSCPFPIRFSKLSVLLNNQDYNNHCVVSDGNSLTSDDSSELGDLYLVPEKVKVHTFTFLPQAQDVGEMLEITSVAVELGNDTSRSAILHWSSAGISSALPPAGQLWKQHGPQQHKSTETVVWQQLDVIPTARIEPRESAVQITLGHEPPCLVNEFYQVGIDILNGETRDIKHVQLSLGLKEGQDPSTEQTTHVSLDTADFEGKIVSRKSGIELDSMRAGEQRHKVMFLKCLTPADRTIFARLTYQVDVDVGDTSIQCQCCKEQTVVLPAVLPFAISVRLASLQFNKIEAVHAEEPFLLLSDIKCTSPWPVEIMTSQTELSPYVRCEDESQESQLSGVSLRCGDSASECCCLVAPASIQPTVPLGQYVLCWRRKSENAAIPHVSSTVTLATVAVEQIPLYIDVDMPAHGNVRRQMPVKYSIYNRTHYCQEIDLTIEASDAFMFAGSKQLHFRVLPHCKYEVNYNLVPLFAGNVLLPRLHINMLRYPGTMNDIVQKMLPSHVFIQPSGREIS